MFTTENSGINNNFRISDIQLATLNGRNCKLFRAFEFKGDAFVFVGQFSAPAKTANRDLWKIARDAA